jgi:PIN domain nuclease of toxin-antitoxin system
MRILLDSTYLFPLIGVRVRGLDPLLLLGLKPRHRLLVSDVSLFELSAKGAKYVVQGVLEPEDVTRGIQSLSMDADIARIPYFTSQILNVSFKLRGTLSDYIDCLILSTAVNESDVLMTEDDILLNFTDDEANRAFLHALNPDLRILDHKQLELLEGA